MGIDACRHYIKTFHHFESKFLFFFFFKSPPNKRKKCQNADFINQFISFDVWRKKEIKKKLRDSTHNHKIR